MITLKNITKIYKNTKSDSITALENIDLSFKKGELIILKGASGSGKSTVLSLIAALTKPTKGEVIVEDTRISKLPDDFASKFRRDTIGFIFQKYNLIENLSVKENIILPLYPENLDPHLLEQKALAVMEKFQIEHKQHININKLSGGEQQRVAIARAHINEPAIILADEPTANLDKKLSENFVQILQELKSQNKTIIVATHDPIFFDLDFVDRIIELQNGKIIS
jgi:putative ABC transport system ATP-binding protein